MPLPRLSRRQFGLLGAHALVGGCGESPPPVRIGSNLWPGYEPLYVLRERGMLPPGLRLVELVSASQVMRGIRNGLLDGGGLTLDEALRLAAETGDVELVAVMDLSAGADAVVGRGEVRTLAQLAGKVVGVEKSAVGAYLLARTLEALHTQSFPAHEIIVVDEMRTGGQ
jgi:NitT/TauT family transport system substrate-binding protein